MPRGDVEKLPRCQHEICDGDNFHLSVIAFQQNRKSCLFLSTRAVREYIFRKRVNLCFQNIIYFFCIITFWEIFCVLLWIILDNCVTGKCFIIFFKSWQVLITLKSKLVFWHFMQRQDSCSRSAGGVI